MLLRQRLSYVFIVVFILNGCAPVTSDEALPASLIDAMSAADATNEKDATADRGFTPPRPPNPPSNVVPGVRSYDGTGNNATNTSWGSTGVQLLRRAWAAYSDGISSPGGTSRPSPRMISNVLVDQGDEDIISDRLLSAMIYAWGQFIDHDLDLTPTAGSEVITIPIPVGDPYFDPAATGTQVLTTFRSIFDPATGTKVSNPRQQTTLITAFLDGSMIYGSDATIATKLRTLIGGQFKTSPGGFLPINNLAYFPTGALVMANDAHIVPDNQLFAAGDVRANENVELLSLHTLFVREHNTRAASLAAANPSLNDEQIYQQARSLVIAEIEAITFNEWLPAMLGTNAISSYPGYNPSVNPGINNEFSTAAFRFGHSLLGDDVEFFDNNGNPVGEEIPLSQAFFNPGVVSQFGIDPILKYLASDPSSELDTQVVNSVRNFLFGPPGAGGLDLASLNIARGRDHGLPDYNTVRQAYGLLRVRGFNDITRDFQIQSKLRMLYGSVNNIDLWVGALAEGHLQGASVGLTLRTIIAEQFNRIRNGDRYWYERVYSGTQLQQLQNTRLVEVIKRNTLLTNLQPNVFFFRAGISGTVFLDSNSDGIPQRGEPHLSNRIVQLVSATENEMIVEERTDSTGHYKFNVLDGLRTGSYFVQVLNKNRQVIAFSRTVAITRGNQLIDRVNIAVLPG